MESKQGTATVAAGIGSVSIGSIQGSAAIRTTADIELITEDGEDFIALEDDTGLLVEATISKRQTASMNTKQGTATVQT